MAKHLLKKTTKANGGKQTRIGIKLHDELKKIRKVILINTNIDEISFEQISNIITRHKLWPMIVTDAGNVKEEEIMEYGKH